MPNGGGPPERILSDANYQIIKEGDVITQGTYNGCVLVDETYYWFTPDSKNPNKWMLKTGVPDEDMCSMDAEVWGMIKDGGTYEWMDEDEWWEDQWYNRFRLAGYAGGELSLVVTGN